jgi:hypothetical protein
MKVCMEVLEVSLGRMEVRIKAGQEQLKATESEANQGQIGVGAEHYEEVPHIYATYFLTVLQG